MERRSYSCNDEASASQQQQQDAQQQQDSKWRPPSGGSARVHPDLIPPDVSTSPGLENGETDSHRKRKHQISFRRTSLRASFGQRSSDRPSMGMGRRGSTAAATLLKHFRRRPERQEENEDWLESILPGFSQNTGNKFSRRFTEDLYLTELCNPRELRWLVLPFGTRRGVWDAMMVVLVLYTAIVLPYFLCFQDANDSPAAWSRNVDLLSDFIFMADIVLNFHTGVVRKSDVTLITDKTTIARLYLSGWFPIDALGSIPWEIVLLISEASGADSQGGSMAGLQIVKSARCRRWRCRRLRCRPLERPPPPVTASASSEPAAGLPRAPLVLWHMPSRSRARALAAGCLQSSRRPSCCA